MRIGAKVQAGANLAEVASNLELAESLGFNPVSRWDHISAGGIEGLDTPTMLTFMAAKSKTVRIASHVVNVSVRNPMLLASQLAVAQAASGGRLEVGLGAGGSTMFISTDHRMTGIPMPRFSDRIKLLEACCRVFPRLWLGEQVTDEVLGIAGASLGDLEIDAPPIIVGGMNDRILQVAARFGDGWNASTLDHAQFEAKSRRIDDLRSPVESEDRFDKQVQLLLKANDLPALGDTLARFAEAGATTALVGVLDLPRVESLHRVAEMVLET